MKKILVTFASVATCTLILQAKPTPQSIETRRHAQMMEKDATLVPPDSVMRPATGKVVVIDMQKKLSAGKLHARANILQSILCTLYQVESEQQPFELKTATDLMEKHKASVAFFVIDDANFPMSLTCLEGGWGLINMAALAEGNPPQEVLARRFAAEYNRVIRSLLVVGGSGRSAMSTTFNGKPRQAPRSGADLDLIKKIGIPMEDARAIHFNMAAFGVRECEIVPYEDACRQGWALPPTNDIQRAIWDNVHAIPNKPMKIEFDPATQKGKVTK